MTSEKKRRENLLSDIARLIETFEDPTGHNCSNNVGAEIDFSYDQGKKTVRYRYIFNGESFDKVPFPKNER